MGGSTLEKTGKLDLEKRSDALESPSRKEAFLKKSKVFCILPWTHLYVHVDGNVFPCCLRQNGAAFGKIGESSLTELWNVSERREMRLAMLSERQSSYCQVCYKLEEAGVFSYRQSSNDTYAEHWSIVDSTRPDGSVDGINLPYLDLRFSNVCNFKCRTCGPDYSSAWQLEENQSANVPTASVVTRLPLKFAKFLEEVETHFENLEEIYFAGGEPLIQTEHYLILSRLAQEKPKNLRLRYNTNLSQLRFQGYDVLELWKNFEDVNVGVSLDGWGSRGEYIRHGQNWERTVENLKRIHRESSHVKIEFTVTVNVLNVLHLPDFHRKAVEEGLVEVDRFSINTLVDPRRLRIQVLPKALKERVRSLYRDHIENFLPRFGADANLAITRFQEVLQYMEQEDLSNEIPDLLKVMKMLDERRGENIEDSLPELSPLWSDSLSSYTQSS